MQKLGRLFPKAQEFMQRYEAVILTAVLLPAFLNIACRLNVSMNAAVYALNVFFFAFVILAGAFVIGSISGGTMLCILLCFIFVEIDTKVIKLRGMPVTPSDLLAAKTAVSVTTTSMIKPGPEDILPVSLFSGLGLFVLYFSRKREKVHIAAKTRMIGTASVFAVLSLYCFAIPFLPVYTHNYDKFEQGAKSGRIVSFFYDTGSLFMRTPKGYSKQEVEVILESYNEMACKQQEKADVLPYIIVVMSEAFCDVTQLNPDFVPEHSYIPFVRSMLEGRENTVSGYLDVSVIGGGTVNTEWEFLTGNSMHNIDSQSIPFQSYISDSTDLSCSLPAILKQVGYELTFLHPYERAGYRRDYVYQQFGFDKLLFQDDFTYSDKVRGYISDASLFAQIEKELIEKGDNTDTPKFIFAVSMQNHSFYEDTEETLKEYPDSFELKDTEYFTDVQGSGPLNTYMTLENITDHDLESFVVRMLSSYRPMIIVFFGDHQPSSTVTECITTEGIKKTDYFKVPFFITANIDIDSASGVQCSPNFLGNILLKKVGIPFNGYRMFLEEIYKKYPSISAWQYRTAEGSSQQWDENPPEDPVLMQYQMLQHYLMKDSRDEKTTG